MFIRMSNIACNKSLNRSFTLFVMHETTKRLYSVLREIDVIKSDREQSELAKFLNKSPQVINNWEDRGISDNGLLEIQSKTGCSATWIRSGKAPKFIGDYVPSTINKLGLEPLSDLEIKLLDAFRHVSLPEDKLEIIGYVKGITHTKQKNMSDLSISKKTKKAAA